MRDDSLTSIADCFRCPTFRRCPTKDVRANGGRPERESNAGERCGDRNLPQRVGLESVIKGTFKKGTFKDMEGTDFTERT